MMTNELKPFQPDDVQEVLTELDKAFYDIPFENSAYQTRAFVIAAQQTPGRAFRAIGLRMHTKIQAVKEYLFQQEKNKIDIEEKQWKLANESLSEFEQRRLRLDIAKIEDGQAWGKKLLNDALRELDVLYAEFKKFPAYSREQFEAEEVQHFDLKLTRAMQAQGPLESLLNMREDLPQFDQRIAIASSEALLKSIAKKE